MKVVDVHTKVKEIDRRDVAKYNLSIFDGFFDRYPRSQSDRGARRCFDNMPACREKISPPNIQASTCSNLATQGS
jgi:hypothetical protein